MILTKKSYAKVNIFLKIVGKKDGYHLLSSRFVKVYSLYDTISFKNGSYDNFTLQGDFNCDTKNNTIYKAYQKMCEISKDVKQYFQNHKVVVDKNIPSYAGLGGGSSNCATFILMVNDICNLGLNKDTLASIGLSIGADVPFFIYNYNSANVTGIGENVEEFKEDILDIQIVTPDIKCDTSEIFKIFSNKFYKELSSVDAKKLLETKSKDILKTLIIDEANDLYEPAIYSNERLKDYAKDKFYFSGSGSSFFKIKG